MQGPEDTAESTPPDGCICGYSVAKQWLTSETHGKRTNDPVFDMFTSVYENRLHVYDDYAIRCYKKAQLTSRARQQAGKQMRGPSLDGNSTVGWIIATLEGFHGGCRAEVTLQNSRSATEAISRNRAPWSENKKAQTWRCSGHGGRSTLERGIALWWLLVWIRILMVWNVFWWFELS